LQHGVPRVVLKQLVRERHLGAIQLRRARGPSGQLQACPALPDVALAQCDPAEDDVAVVHLLAVHAVVDRRRHHDHSFGVNARLRQVPEMKQKVRCLVVQLCRQRRLEVAVFQERLYLDQLRSSRLLLPGEVRGT
jgi:hypothetical protein